ncbi:unnamed protein product [Symbiodinium sp. CCMP2592]|nr:unnamed protein product [Symbiodinium sp. CCMP2592]
MADDAARRAYVAQHVSADLVYVWEEMGVSLLHQRELGERYRSVALFSSIADTRADARTALRAEVTVADNADGRAAVAGLVAAWQSCYDMADQEDNRDISTTLAEVRTDAALKETYFVGPLALELASRGSSSTAPPPPAKWPRLQDHVPGAEGSAKGKGGKGRGKGGKNSLRIGYPSARGFVSSSTPDGRQICYAYNNGSCKGDCGRVHVCQLCLKPHPRKSCKLQKEKGGAEAVAVIPMSGNACSEKPNHLEANFGVLKCFEICFIRLELCKSFLFEHPEQLGAVNDFVPASVWDFDEFKQLLLLDGVQTAAFFQCQWEHLRVSPLAFYGAVSIGAKLHCSLGRRSLRRRDAIAVLFHPLVVIVTTAHYWGRMPRVIGPPPRPLEQATWDSGDASTFGRRPLEQATWDSDASSDEEGPKDVFELSSLRLELPAGSWPPAGQTSDAESFAARLLKKGRVTVEDFERLCGLLPSDPEVRATAGDLTSKTFMSGFFQHGGVIGLRTHVSSHPWVTALLCGILRAALPGYTFTSVVVSRNRQVLPHCDSQNGANTWNLLVPASRFKGGGVWQEVDDGCEPMEYEGEQRWGKILPVATGPQLLDPRRLHATMSWKGVRTVIIGFSIREPTKASRSLKTTWKRLSGLQDVSQTDEAVSGGITPSVRLLEQKAGEEGDTFHGHLVQARKDNFGDPITVQWRGKVHSFVDGCGLNSPGRWRPTARGRGLSKGADEFVNALRSLLDDFIRTEIVDPQRAYFMLALGKYEEAPFSVQAMDRLRRSWFALLEDPSAAALQEPGQPFFLEALSQTCRAMGDEDWEVLTRAEDNYARGRRLGVDRPFPRVVAVFRPKGAMEIQQEDGHRLLIGIAADIAKAHRRYKHAPEDHGYLGCRARPDGPIWINRVGTFGVACAAYHFARLAGLIGRGALRIALQASIFQMLFADDLQIMAGGEQKYHDLWVFAWIIGFYFDYFRFKVGLSERRANWLIEFITDLQRGRGMIEHRRFTEFVGRLVYAGQVLYWLRPFMGPLHRWKAAITPGTVALVPRMVMVVLRYILTLLQEKHYLVCCKSPPLMLREAFRTDAKAEDDFFVLGGWETLHSFEPKKCRWFSVRVSAADYPFLFNAQGTAKGMSTVAELLATWLGLHLFGWLDVAGQSFTVSAGTDNLANELVMRRQGTTKFPLTYVYMQLEYDLFRCGGHMNLNWRPRELNTEADDLTNERFSAFDLALRIDAKFSDVPCKLLLDLASFHSEMLEWRKGGEGSAPPAPLTKKQKLATKTKW